MSPLILVQCWLEKLCLFVTLPHHNCLFVTIATTGSIFIANGMSCFFISNGMSCFLFLVACLCLSLRLLLLVIYRIAQLFAVTKDIGHVSLYWSISVAIGSTILYWYQTSSMEVYWLLSVDMLNLSWYQAYRYCNRMVLVWGPVLSFSASINHAEGDNVLGYVCIHLGSGPRYSYIRENWCQVFIWIGSRT